MHGKGKLIYANGNLYNGGFFDGKKFGEGSFTWKQTGVVYAGKWHSDKMHGEGVLKNNDGSVRKLKYLQGEIVKDYRPREDDMGESGFKFEA